MAAKKVKNTPPNIKKNKKFKDFEKMEKTKEPKLIDNVETDESLEFFKKAKKMLTSTLNASLKKHVVNKQSVISIEFPMPGGIGDVRMGTTIGIDEKTDLYSTQLDQFLEILQSAQSVIEDVNTINSKHNEEPVKLGKK